MSQNASFPGGGRDDSRKKFKTGCLSSSVGSKQRHKLASLHRQIDVLESVHHAMLSSKKPRYARRNALGLVVNAIGL